MIDFSAIINFKDLIFDFVFEINSFFDKTIGDLFPQWVGDPLMGQFTDITMLEWLFVSGIAFIITYNLIKWVFNISAQRGAYSNGGV